MSLVERSSALADLRKWNDEVRAGDGRLVLICGEAGVGKTSLLQEFVASPPQGHAGFARASCGARATRWPHPGRSGLSRTSRRRLAARSRPFCRRQRRARHVTPAAWIRQEFRGNRSSGVFSGA
ncbi:MAG: ATP-binding protein [Streptosporangiaceae bacterium]